jgi:HEAT repeat protein
MEPNNGMPCCRDLHHKAQCSLSDRSNDWSSTDSQQPDSKTLTIYFKTVDQKTTELFLAGSECHVEPGTDQVLWLSAVSELQSLTYLHQLAQENQRATAHQAIAAIALHASDGAGQKLKELITDGHPHLQESAIFWMGKARNKAGFDYLKNLLEDSRISLKLRQQAIFALSVNPTPAAVDTLTALATGAQEEALQAEAIFWLAQNHPDQSIEVIQSVIATSQSERILDKSVFALAQLPQQHATPALIAVVNSNLHRTARKKALFWLGQSDDEKAYLYLEKLLVN